MGQIHFRIHRCGCLSLLLLFVACSLHSQDSGKLPAYMSAYRSAEKWFHSENANETTDSLAYGYYRRIADQLKKENTFNAILVDCDLKCGILRMSQNNNQQALAFFRDAVDSWQKGALLPDSLLFRPYLYMGSIRYNLNELDSAVYYYKKADEISNRYHSLSESERLYNKLGALYYETGDLKKCIPYFEKALSIVTESKTANAYFFIVNYKNNIATALLKMGDYQQALTIYKSLLGYNINKDQLYSNIATVNVEQENLQEALKYYRLVIQNSAEKYNHLSMVFLKMQQRDSAAYYNAKAMALYSRNGANRGIDYVLTLKYAGDIASAAGNIAEGISHYQSALIQLVPGFTNTGTAKNPLVFTGLQNFSVLFDVLTAKGNGFKSLDAHQSNRQYKINALAAYAAALALARYAERTYSSDEARLFLKNKVNSTCSEAVTLALQLYREENDQHYIAAAFGYAENNKASVLQAGIQQLELAGIAGLPAGMVEEEKKYKSIIARFTIQLSQVRDSISQTALQKNIQGTELLLSSLQEKLDDNPAYHRLKFHTKEISLEKIQHELAAKNDQAILSYYYTGKQLLCFYITSTVSGCTSVALTKGFFVAIASLRKELENFAGAGRKPMNSISQSLFQSLLQPVIEKIKDKKHLLVIPYNEISYVPFELLQNEKDGSLMLSKFAISYHYSANFLFDKDADKGSGYKVLAMAPFTEQQTSRSILPALPSSGMEIANLPGKIMTGAAATRAQFIALAGQYPVIHLATHAVANDKDPLGCYIEFYGEKSDNDSVHRLYEKEIYNLDMQQARLVILSACETGNGLLVNGEGIESLSRSFSYAGCKSVITSLWKADDMATAFIMKQLHVYLQKGFSKDEALQKAKLDYLDDPATEERYKTPAYWAHLVLIGNQQPVVEKSSRWYIPVTAGLLLMSCFVFLYNKRKRAQNAAPVLVS